ncbi:Uncharacterised protein [Mycobacterium tuberculosis]|nr:Uncharacterised protein [Mycobacterium tuberculosis]
MGPGSPGVDHTLGYPLVVEMKDFLPEKEILKQGRSPRSGPQGIEVIGDRCSLVAGERPFPGSVVLWVGPVCLMCHMNSLKL